VRQTPLPLRPHCPSAHLRLFYKRVRTLERAACRRHVVNYYESIYRALTAIGRAA
jgi:hypothetical protein